MIPHEMYAYRMIPCDIDPTQHKMCQKRHSRRIFYLSPGQTWAALNGPEGMGQTLC